jgi:DNA primase
MQRSAKDIIKDRLPITDVLASYITLIPAGSQYKAKCPFHNERTASFSISPERGVYYCFGCGAKGDIFNFVEAFEGTDFKGALKILADRAGVPLDSGYTKRDDTDPVYEILERAAIKYQSELAGNKEALLYLEKRGLHAESISSFRIGYAPEEWRYIANGIDQQEILVAERAGLVKKTEKGYYDRFRGRIMFPISDSSGRIIGFSGRTFPDREGEPKYLNSPETEVFQKSRILFGFDKAKFAIKKHNFAILVEGQMDLVLSHQYGFKNTVATSGTAVSDSVTHDSSAQLTVISRLTPNLFLAFDGDSAGEKALARAALVALALGLNPKVVPLPPGIDPADYLSTNGTDGWKELLKVSKHFILHQIDLVRRDAQSPHAFSRLLKERVFPFLARVASPIEQKLYVDMIANELNIGASEIMRELSSLPAQSAPAAPVQESVKDTALTPTERFAALLECYKSDRVSECLSRVRAISFDGKGIELPVLSDERKVEALSIIERDYGTLDEVSRDNLIEELSKKIATQFYNELRTTYSQSLRVAEARGDEASVEELLTKLQDLNKRRHSD